MNASLPAMTMTRAGDRTMRHAAELHTVLIRGDGRVLLQKLSANINLAPGRWSTISGNLEPGERVTATAARNLREETGVEVNPNDLSFLSLTRHINDEGSDPAFAVFFIATRWTGTPQIIEPERCERLDWFALDGLPAPIVPYVAKALRELTVASNGLQSLMPPASRKGDASVTLNPPIPNSPGQPSYVSCTACERNPE